MAMNNNPKYNHVVEIKYYLIVIMYCMPILYMQYSKHKWNITQPDNLLDFLPILHSELTIFLIVALVVYVIPILKSKTFFIFFVIYIFSLFDLLSWFFIERPFHPMDVLRVVDLIKDYSEFISSVNKMFLLKIVFLAIIPVLIAMVKNCTFFISYLKKHTPELKYICISVFLIYLGSLPFIYTSNYFSFNSFVKTVKESIYEYRLAKIPNNDLKIKNMLGVSAKKRDPLLAQKICGGKCQYYNIIIFIIETAPYKYYPDLKECAAATNNTFLLENGIVFKEHYTTYPESDRAILSIMTGKYPPLSRGYAWVKEYNYGATLPRILNNLGYKSYFVSTAPLNFHNNLGMLQHIGFTDIYEVKKTKQAFKIEKGKQVWDRAKLYGADIELLKKTIEIIDSHANEESTPYLLVAAPQASHAPFQKPSGIKVKNDGDIGLIKANAIWQFRLIKKIVDRLAETKQLCRTIFILTGDHGIRSKYESKKLFTNPHLLSEVTFHVPFMISCGCERPLNTWANTTSHVDITPTLLDLLYLDYSTEEVHGINMFKEVNRTIFFLGGEYLPVSGYKRGPSYYMENRYRGIVGACSVFDFSKCFNGNKLINKQLLKSQSGFNPSRLQENVSGDLMEIKRLLRKTS